MENLKKLLHESRNTIVIQKEEQQFTSTKRGIAPILDILNEDCDLLQGAFVADKVIGKAAALLLIYGKVKQIYAEVISELAVVIFDKYKVPYSFHEKVPYIINRTKTDMCPMEKCVLEIDEPEEALEALKLAVAKIQREK